jgi:extracellular factor (EF) 3-hydroxypalmitic acid methyl ester biosynthesis protein
MHNQRFFDLTLRAIETGQLSHAYPMLAGKLFADYADPDRWSEARRALHEHPLHGVLMEDPYTARAAFKPRGYAGDAELIDLIYDRIPPQGSSSRAVSMFSSSIAFPVAEAVRQRRNYAEQRLSTAWAAGKQICALACGHLREADPLAGRDVSNIVAVDQDALSLDFVCATYGATIRTEQANVIHFLRNAAKRGERFDLIYTLGLTDYFDARAMSLLHRLMKACLAPGGEIMLANFLPGHLAIGWMDAVMDWQLIYREEADLHRHAAEICMTSRTFRDVTDSIVFCEMTDKHGRPTSYNVEES